MSIEKPQTPPPVGSSAVLDVFVNNLVQITVIGELVTVVLSVVRPTLDGKATENVVAIRYLTTIDVINQMGEAFRQLAQAVPHLKETAIKKRN